MTPKLTRHVALFKGVNVGGHNKVPMARLRELAAEVGFTDVATHLQSGNLVFTSDQAESKLITLIGDALRRDLGVDVEVMVRHRDEIAAIISADVLGDVATDPAKRLVSFLTARPAAARTKALDPDSHLPERWEVSGRELYMWCPEGIGRSKLATAPWGRWLGTPGTARNWRTVLALAALLDE